MRNFVIIVYTHILCAEDRIKIYAELRYVTLQKSVVKHNANVALKHHDCNIFNAVV